MVKVSGKWFQPSHIAMVDACIKDGKLVSNVILSSGFAVTVNMSPDEFVVAARMATPGFSKDLPGGRTPTPPSP